MQSILREMPGWMNHKLESRFPGEISTTSNTTLLAESEEELKSLLMMVKEQREKVGLTFSTLKKLRPWIPILSLNGK